MDYPKHSHIERILASTGLIFCGTTNSSIFSRAWSFAQKPERQGQALRTSDPAVAGRRISNRTPITAGNRAYRHAGQRKQETQSIMTLAYLARLPGSLRRRRRLLKLLVTIVFCFSISYFACVLFEKNNVNSTCECGGDFADEIQKTNDTTSVQPTMKHNSRGYEPEEVQNSTSFKKNDVTFAIDSGGHLTDVVQKPTVPPEEERKGRLTMSIWQDLCGDKVKVLTNSPFYPSFPNEKLIRVIPGFQIVDNKTRYGQMIAGFLNPATSGSYRFAIASDDSSELWLSPSENSDEKELIASVFIEGATGWTTKNEINKYPNQISRDIELREGGRYYIEVIHKQGEGAGFVQVFWSNPGVTDFKLISSEYLSSCSVSPEQDAMNQILSKRLAISQTAAWKKYLSFFTLPLLSEGNYLPQCIYKSSFIPKDKIDIYNGRSLVYLSNVFPQDDTFMGSKGNVWSWSNTVADGELVQSVVDKMIASLSEKTAK